MIKNFLLYFCLSMGLAFPVYAEEETAVAAEQPAAEVAENVNATENAAEQVTENAPEAEVAESQAEIDANTKQENQKILENTNASLTEEKEPEFVEVYQVEKDIKSLPSCDDEKLHNEVKAYVQSYFAKTLNWGTLERRHQYFVLSNLNRFEEKNIADYKTAETSPISDLIAHIKMNNGIIEENMRLCKNTSTNKHAGKIYLLIYPENDDNYIVNVINLSRVYDEQGTTFFTYAK